MFFVLLSWFIIIQKGTPRLFLATSTKLSTTQCDGPLGFLPFFSPIFFFNGETELHFQVDSSSFLLFPSFPRWGPGRLCQRRTSAAWGPWRSDRHDRHGNGRHGVGLGALGVGLGLLRRRPAAGVVESRHVF